MFNMFNWLNKIFWIWFAIDQGIFRMVCWIRLQ
jgi:hypothetical protein